MIPPWSTELVLIRVDHMLDRTLTVSSMIDRIQSRLIELINALWSIGWSIDHIVLAGSIDYPIDLDQSIESIDHPIDRERSIGLIDHPIDQ
jgi:hypothetical protein